MSHRYDSDKQVQHILNKMASCRDPEKIEIYFSSLGVLGEDAAAYVVDALEKNLVDELSHITPAEKEEIRGKLILLAEAKKDPVPGAAEFVRQIEAEFGDTAKYLTNALKMLMIYDFKNDDADPLVKAYVEELGQKASLKPDEPPVAADFLDVAIKAHDRIFGTGAAPAPKKPNPFHPKP